MINPLLAPELEDLIASNDTETLHDFCMESHAPSVGEFLSALAPKDIWKVLLTVDLERRAELFNFLDPEVQSDTVEILSRKDLADILTEMPSDDRVHLFRRLPEARQELVMPAIARAEREDIRRLIQYEEGTAGAMMTSEYATVSPSMTAGDAIAHLRRIAPDRETIYDAYVLDDDRHLLGSVALRDIILAQPQTPVSELISTEIATARPDDDREDVVHKVQQYDLIALPVVTEENILVGIVTYDDAMDVQTKENQEDVEKMASISSPQDEDATYFSVSPWAHFRSRAGWILAFCGVEVISGALILRCENALQAVPLLIAFIPMLTAAGGNAGGQSTALVVRGLSDGELTFSDIGRIFRKELCISLLLGATLGLVAFLRAFVFNTSPAAGGLPALRVAATIAVAIAAQVVSATALGALLPLGAARLKIDPALVSNPLLTTTVDVTGLLLYFSIASLMLGIR